MGTTVDSIISLGYNGTFNYCYSANTKFKLSYFRNICFQEIKILIIGTLFHNLDMQIYVIYVIRILIKNKEAWGQYADRTRVRYCFDTTPTITVDTAMPTLNVDCTSPIRAAKSRLNFDKSSASEQDRWRSLRLRQKYASSQQKIQLDNLKSSRGLGLRFLRIRPDSQI